MDSDALDNHFGERLWHGAIIPLQPPRGSRCVSPIRSNAPSYLGVALGWAVGTLDLLGPDCDELGLALGEDDAAGAWPCGPR